MSIKRVVQKFLKQETVRLLDTQRQTHFVVFNARNVTVLEHICHQHTQLRLASEETDDTSWNLRCGFCEEFSDVCVEMTVSVRGLRISPVDAQTACTL